MNGLNTSERYGKGRLDQPKCMYWTSYDNGGYEDYIAMTMYCWKQHNACNSYYWNELLLMETITNA